MRGAVMKPREKVQGRLQEGRSAWRPSGKRRCVVGESRVCAIRKFGKVEEGSETNGKKERLFGR